MDDADAASARLSPRAKLTICIALAILASAFLWQIHGFLSPFLWALVAAYLLNPIVNYLNLEGRLPRLWAVALLYALAAIILVTASRYLYPKIIEQRDLFLEDVPRLDSSIRSLVGDKPLGINVDSVIRQLVKALTGYTTNTTTAQHLLVNALETIIKFFLFLVSTFYLLVDAPRLRRVSIDAIPEPYRDELVALGRKINVTWHQYIRGELVLFGIMAAATTIGLTILQVPGAIFLGLASGALELLPLVGPWTAGGLAVSVAYFSDTNPWGWSSVAYAGVVAIMYFVLRQAEDYAVIPNVLGRAVRLHPLVVLFAVTIGGVTAGLFGLVIAVPIAASIKEVWLYLYAKLLDLPIVFEPVRTLGGGVIEIPVRSTAPPAEDPAADAAGST